MIKCIVGANAQFDQDQIDLPNADYDQLQSLTKGIGHHALGYPDHSRIFLASL